MPLESQAAGDAVVADDDAANGPAGRMSVAVDERALAAGRDRETQPGDCPVRHLRVRLGSVKVTDSELVRHQPGPRHLH